MNASLDGRSDWIGGAELAALPNLAADMANLGHIISGYSAVTGRYELCGLTDYFGERSVETSGVEKESGAALKIISTVPLPVPK